MHNPNIPLDKWRSMDVADRMNALLGMKDDDAFLLLSIPWAEADLHERTLKIRVWEVLTKLDAKWGLELHRDQREERERILDSMRKELEPKSEPKQSPAMKAQADWYDNPNYKTEPKETKP